MQSEPFENVTLNQPDGFSDILKCHLEQVQKKWLIPRMVV